MSALYSSLLYMEFPKIETLFDRDEKFGVIVGKFRNPVYDSFKTWHVTEKVDGTNVRIMLSEEGKVTIGGRTDAAQMSTDLVQYLQETFTEEKMKEVFWLRNEGGERVPTKAVLYGEGYGAGIQKGGSYRKDKSFRLFDVLVSDKFWLDWKNVEDVASKLGIKTVPYLGEWTMEQIISNVKEGVPSNVALEENGDATFISEGIVARTIEPLFDRRGKRIILKLKTKDFK